MARPTIFFQRIIRTAREAPFVLVVTGTLVWLLWNFGFPVITIVATASLSTLFVFWFRRFLGIG